MSYGRRPRLLALGLAALALAVVVWTVRLSLTATYSAVPTWRVLDNGAGSVTGDASGLTLSPAPAIDAAQARSAVAVIPTSLLGDYSYSVRVTTQRLPDNAAPSLVRLLVRYTPGQGGYYVSHSAAGLELSRLDNAHVVVLARSARPAAGVDGSHAYRVDTDADTLRVFVDDELWISYADPEPLASGQPGIWIEGARATVTDASVRLTGTEQSPPRVSAGQARLTLAHSDDALSARLPTLLPATPSPTALLPSSASSPLPDSNVISGTLEWGNTDAAGAPAVSPRAVSGVDAVTALAAGRSHTIAADDTGSVWTWGIDGDGQLGRPATATCLSASRSTVCDLTPGAVSELHDVVRVAAGGDHSLVLRADGTLWSWGANDAGQLGDGSTEQRAAPVQVDSLTNVSRIAAGQAFSLALKADGTVWAWGANEAGQLGDGTNVSSSTPVRVRDLDSVVAIAAGDYFSLGLRSNGSVWAWGANEYGQLGLGAPSSGRNAPVPVSALGATTAIAAGGYHALALDAAGATWGWGANWFGELGSTGTETCLWNARQQPCSSTPQRVAGLPGEAGDIAAGEFHTLALLRDGHIWAWGLNAQGQLGDGTDQSSDRPVQVVGLSSTSLIAAGGQHSLAVRPAPNPRQPVTP